MARIGAVFLVLGLSVAGARDARERFETEEVRALLRRLEQERDAS